MLFLFLIAAITGPSSSQPPYLIGVQSRVNTVSVMTTGDRVGSFRLAGIPDGLGAYDNGDGTFTLLVNHEIADSLGAVRAHGGRGAFVSKLTIRKRNLAVIAAEDLIKSVFRFSRSSNNYERVFDETFDRLCSADLAAAGAFYDADTATGLNARLFLNGEEVSPSGRAFAHELNGTSWELPRLGRAAWENQVTHPASGLKTIVVGLDDSPGGQLYVYVGTKTNVGTSIDRAGLTNGRLYGLRVSGYPAEPPAGIPSTAFQLLDLGDVTQVSGDNLQALSVALDITAWQRPEDGAWDPKRRNDFYFATTGTSSAPSRLWRLRFDDIDDPTRGGMVDMMFDANAGPQAMDNLTITGDDQLFVQEDLGGSGDLAGVWRYDLRTGSRPVRVAEHDPVRFGGGPGTISISEESSGIIDVSDILGEGWLILTSQPHDPSEPDLVQGGQILAMQINVRRRIVSP